MSISSRLRVLLNKDVHMESNPSTLFLVSTPWTPLVRNLDYLIAALAWRRMIWTGTLVRVRQSIRGGVETLTWSSPPQSYRRAWA